MLQVDYCFVQKVLSRCINTFGHGGGRIKRQSMYALLIALTMAMSILPSAVGAADQSASDNSAQIGLGEPLKHSMFGVPKSSISGNANVLKVNAASSVKVKVWYKHWYKSWHKHWYRSYGTWHYYWSYSWKYSWKYYYKYKTSTVKAASSSSSSSYTSSGKANTFSDPKLNSIMKSAAGYGYSSGISTASGLVAHKAGDCWAYSAYLNGKFKAAGYKSRVIQYATSYSSRHRSVQLYQNGQWKTVPYRAYGYNYYIV